MIWIVLSLQILTIGFVYYFIRQITKAINILKLPPNEFLARSTETPIDSNRKSRVIKRDEDDRIIRKNA